MVLPLLRTGDAGLQQAAREAVHAIASMPLLPADRSAVQLKLLTLLAREMAAGEGRNASSPTPLLCAQLAHDTISASSLDLFTYSGPVEAALQVRLLLSTDAALSPDAALRGLSFCHITELYRR
jgi:hypothetical protein